MDIWDEIKKLTGYQSGSGGVDSYGVDHSGFSLRDELEYQNARQERENWLAQNFDKQGIAEENYPQFGTDFWGVSPENNYGFGTTNIKPNIENVTNQLNSSGIDSDTNNEQIFANSDYTINTESLVGKPSSYFQNNNSVFVNNNNSNFENKNSGGNLSSYTSNLSDSTSNVFSTNTNFSVNPNYGTTPTLQNQNPTPWSNLAEQISPVPWHNNQTITPRAGGYDLSEEDIIPKNSNSQPYIFSDDMRNRLGELESGNNYTKVNSEGGGIGALGRYQIRRDGFKDAGYINVNNQWSGKNDINSTDDYLNNSVLQEQALDDFMEAKYNQLQNNGSRQYLGYQIKGIVNNFNITDTGLLAASHREGAGAVHNYLSHLEKDSNGRYYMNYDKISDPRQREMFKRIETRLRKFEK